MKVRGLTLFNLLPCTLCICLMICLVNSSIPSFKQTKITSDGQLIQINLLEQELERFIGKVNSFPSENFDSIFDEYFPEPEYEANSTTLKNTLHIHLPSIPDAGGSIPSRFDELIRTTFVGNMRDLSRVVDMELKKSFKNIHIEYSKSDVIYLVDKPHSKVERFGQVGDDKQSTFADLLNISPQDNTERYFVAFRRRYLIVHKNQLRIMLDGFNLMLWEKNTQEDSNGLKKRPYLIRMWHENYDRTHFVYQCYGEHLATPYEHNAESVQKFTGALFRINQNHDDEHGNPRMGITEDMKFGHTPKRVLGRMFPLTADENAKITSEIIRVMSDKVEFAFPMNTAPVIGYEKSRLFYSALINSNLIDRAVIFPTSPVFTYNSDLATASITYLLYPSKDLPKSSDTPVSCPAIIHFSVNHYQKISRFHVYMDVEACVQKLMTGEGEAKWVTVDL